MQWLVAHTWQREVIFMEGMKEGMKQSIKSVKFYLPSASISE